jgi:prephenate dehydrogenase
LRLPRLKEIWEKFENIQGGLECLEVDPSKHDEYRSEFENLFYEVNVAMARLIEENDARELQGQERRSLEGSVHSNNSSNHHSHIKLPIIKLPTFKGG